MRVSSTNIQEVWYDQRSKVLAVRFRKRPYTLYNFMGVPKIVWTDFIKSKSKGTFFDQCVRYSYRYKKRFYNFSSSKYNEELFF